MKINTKATNISLTPAISDYVEKKISLLEKFFKNPSEVLINVEVGKTTKHHKSGNVFLAEIHIVADGEEYYATTETEDLYAAIDLVKDDIAREMTSRRKKAIRMLRRGGAHLKNILRGIVDIRDRSWKRIKNFRKK
jgi:putative sigma-54 modulation protein